MNYALIVSPDKISLNKCTSQLKRYFVDVPLGSIHSLMTTNNIEMYVESFIENNSKGLFSYYVKKWVTDNPLSKLPKILRDNMDIIIWFDLYSTEMKILKDTHHETTPLIKEWDLYIKRMGGTNL